MRNLVKRVSSVGHPLCFTLKKVWKYIKCYGIVFMQFRTEKQNLALTFYLQAG